jgi:tetratricopeptide (TPR) repeat protein
MHRAARTSRFLIDISSSLRFSYSESGVSLDGLIQNLLVSRLARAANSRQALNELTCRLIPLAEQAFSLRDISALQAVSQILANLPLAGARQIGQYYQALAISRNGQTEEALSLLEAVAEDAPLSYRARAIQTLGSIYHRQGHLDEALRLYPEAMQAASSENGRDPLTILLAQLELACIKSERGEHREALAAYESLSPLVRLVSKQHPLYFYFYHNELAVEFAELGRIVEAKAASAIALASPFACAYPEWRETRDEIAAKHDSATPSVVTTSRATEADASQQIQSAPKPAPARSLAVSSVVRSHTRRDTFQRSTIPIAQSRAIANAGITRSILDRVLGCIGPRAPPPLF